MAKNTGILVIGGAALAAYLLFSKPAKATSTTPGSNSTALSYKTTGIIYKCDSLVLVDKDKFNEFSTNFVKEYFAKYKFEDFKMYVFIGDFIQKINPTCYKKYPTLNYTDNEKIILLLFAWHFSSKIPEVLFGESSFKSGWENDPNIPDEVKDKMQQWLLMNHYSKFVEGLNIGGDFKNNKGKYDWLEGFWDLNGNKFPPDVEDGK